MVDDDDESNMKTAEDDDEEDDEGDTEMEAELEPKKMKVAELRCVLPSFLRIVFSGEQYSCCDVCLTANDLVCRPACQLNSLLYLFSFTRATTLVYLCSHCCCCVASFL